MKKNHKYYLNILSSEKPFKSIYNTEIERKAYAETVLLFLQAYYF